MKQFIGEVELKEVDKTNWSLINDFSYENDKYLITCKSGFITDGCSIPKPFWSIFGSPLEGDLLSSAIIHDGLYTAMTIPRDICDELLKEMLEFNGVSEERTDLIYAAVRAFGSTHWNKDSSAQINLVDIKVK